MHNQSFVFAQLASHLNRSKFNRIVAKYQGDSDIKHFSCWNQLKVLIFGQLSRRESLRDLIVAVEAHSGKAKFLGFGDSVTRSNLAKANQNRDCLCLRFHNRRTLPCSLLLGAAAQAEPGFCQSDVRRVPFEGPGEGGRPASEPDIGL
ncbi:MAG: DUF4372 domain-containing protein [Bacteroidales bacterium]|nr:DUF4372 domain-containing protein [Bacteroidales bacterium]